MKCPFEHRKYDFLCRSIESVVDSATIAGHLLVDRFFWKFQGHQARAVQEYINRCRKLFSFSVITAIDVAIYARNL